MLSYSNYLKDKSYDNVNSLDLKIKTGNWFLVFGYQKRGS